jgi:RNA polymerase primary sigma factor
VHARAEGFLFRYRLGGEAPLVRALELETSSVVSRGDMVSLKAGAACLARGGDSNLVGVVLGDEPAEISGTARVITDADAVYAVEDDPARAAGSTLGLTGETGAQGVAETPDGELEVVLDSPAGEATLVRIRTGRHHVLPPSGEVRRDLAAERERQLVLAAAAGDRAAVAHLVEAFLPAISGVARLYRNTAAVERAELLQEGVVGLLRALKRYDPSLGTPFWAYASWWVRQAMQQLVAEVARPTALSDRALRGLARLKEARREFLVTRGREPSLDELAAASGQSRDKVESLLAVERTPRGLQEPVSTDEGTSATLGELLPDPLAEHEYESVIERLEIEHVRDLTAGLGERERTILCEHYGLGRPARTLREIGEDLGVSAERVRQIEERTLAGLRATVATSGWAS